VLQPFITALIPFMPGYLELPESYVGLLKGASHKYIRRVPKSGGGYRYFYHVGHGGGIANADHFVPGASFRFDGGHYHIKSEEGGKLTIEHDETKERKTVSKAELQSMLTAHHEPAIKAHREKVAGMLADARANKASPKQIAKLEAQAKAAGVDDSKTDLKASAPPAKSAGLGKMKIGESAWSSIAEIHGPEYASDDGAWSEPDFIERHKLLLSIAKKGHLDLTGLSVDQVNDVKQAVAEIAESEEDGGEAKIARSLMGIIDKIDSAMMATRYAPGRKVRIGNQLTGTIDSFDPKAGKVSVRIAGRDTPLLVSISNVSAGE